MPIDTSPEGGEIMHQPLVKPFPESTEKTPTSDKDAQDAADDRIAQEAEDLAAARLSAENQGRVAQEQAGTLAPESSRP